MAQAGRSALFALLLCTAVAAEELPGTPPSPTDPYSSAPTSPSPSGPPLASSARPRPERGSALQLSTHAPAAAAAVWACADALALGRRTTARSRCGEALAKDEGLAVAHLLAAEAQGTEEAAVSRGRALALAGGASFPERLWIEAVRALREGRVRDARGLYDQLCALVPADPRLLVERGRLRQSALDLEGALADYHRALELAPAALVPRVLLARALAEGGRAPEARLELERAAAIEPKEAAVLATRAELALEAGEGPAAILAAKQALATDPLLWTARAALGDAQLFLGHAQEARRAYAALTADADPQIHHAGAMRAARARLFQSRFAEAEAGLRDEAEAAARARRPRHQAEALLELARVLVDRGALVEAGRALKDASSVLGRTSQGPWLEESERGWLKAELLRLRALALGALGERECAEARAEEMRAGLARGGDREAVDRARDLRGWIAARNGDDAQALSLLAGATRPTLRMALALAAARQGDLDRARRLMEAIARRGLNDLESALTRPRAQAWLKGRSTP